MTDDRNSPGRQVPGDFVPDSNLTFQVRTHPQYLHQAARAVDLNPNAVVVEDAEQVGSQLGAQWATLDYPSFFCDQRRFVLVLAFLARRAQPFEIILQHSNEGSADIDSYAMIFPALDQQTLDILRQINPSAADEMQDLNQRIETVLNRILKLRFSPEIDGLYDMGEGLF